MTDWATIASFATAGGTLVLAVATFASVRSGNRAARVAEDSLLVNIRPLLVPSRLEDAPLKASFGDDHWVQVPGGNGTVEATDRAIYFTMSVRNAGTGIAVLHGWRIEPDPAPGGGPRPAIDGFRRLTRDLYIAAGDIGFWQGAIRDPSDAQWDLVLQRIADRQRIIIDVLYGDHQGAQRMIGRFSLIPASGSDRWLLTVARHWNVDRPDPR